jgi:hypothetical protein
LAGGILARKTAVSLDLLGIERRQEARVVIAERI